MRMARVKCVCSCANKFSTWVCSVLVSQLNKWARTVKVAS